MTIDKHTRGQARKWADRVKSFDHGQMEGNAPAAAEVILSLPEEIVDGGKVREVINAQLDNYQHGTVGHQVAEELACKLQALLPAPQPRTLAEMSPKEREACQWMQATVLDEEDAMTGVIQKVRQDIVWLMFRSGNRNDYRLDEVVPRDDLPRMEWPDDQFSDLPESAQETLKASVEDYKAGRFVDVDLDQGANCQGSLNSSSEPQPGEAWLIRTASGECREAVLYNEGEWNGTDDNGGYEVWWKNVTLLRRLVPAQEPRVLTTAEDYVSAPVGTIIGGGGNHVWEKVGKSRWVSPFFADKSNLDMAGVTITVLWEPKP